jgi:hypothetical protein
VACCAQAECRSTGTCRATASSRSKHPAAASPATTVATIGLVSDPTWKRVSAVTGAPVPTSATP